MREWLVAVITWITVFPVMVLLVLLVFGSAMETFAEHKQHYKICRCE